jgi:hypothetical protein
MKHANNVHAMSFAYSVEDDMAAYMQSSVSGTNMITGFAEFVVLSQLVKSQIKLGQVLVSLAPSPGFLREFRNPFQVSLSRILYPEVSH